MISLVNVLSAGALRAQQEEVPEIGGDLAPTLLQLLGALLLIVAFIYASVWLMKRYSTGKVNNGGGFVTIIERKHLTPKQALYVLKVGDEHLLVGATESGINKICDVKVPESTQPPNKRTSPQESKFSQLLNQAKNSLMPLISTKRKEIET